MRFCLWLALALAGCSRSESFVSSSQVIKDPAAARALIETGATVLDVRSPDEFAAGHVPNAVNVPVETVPSRLAEIEALVGSDRSKPIVVYCAAGGRAAKAKTALDEAGFTKVVNGGGFRDLK